MVIALIWLNKNIEDVGGMCCTGTWMLMLLFCCWALNNWHFRQRITELLFPFPVWPFPRIDFSVENLFFLFFFFSFIFKAVIWHWHKAKTNVFFWLVFHVTFAFCSANKNRREQEMEGLWGMRKKSNEDSFDPRMLWSLERDKGTSYVLFHSLSLYNQDLWPACWRKTTPILFFHCNTKLTDMELQSSQVVCLLLICFMSSALSYFPPLLLNV